MAPPNSTSFVIGYRSIFVKIRIIFEYMHFVGQIRFFPPKYPFPSALRSYVRFLQVSIADIPKTRAKPASAA